MLDITKKYLLDTHILLWAIFDVSKLSREIKELLEEEDNQIYVSTISLFEISIKKSIGKLNISNKAFFELEKEIEYLGFFLIYPQVNTYLQFSNIPMQHTDPFDRMLIAQAIYEKFCFVTQDRKIVKFYKNTGLRILSSDDCI